MKSETVLFTREEVNSINIVDTLNYVVDALEKSGYNAINQLVGYLISGDPGYITNRFNAREKITKYERSELLTELIKGYLGN